MGPRRGALELAPPQDPLLLAPSLVMAWLIPVALVVVGTGWFVKNRRRHVDQGLTSEPVSGDWLAHARSRGDHQW
ncbi:MAG: hypothetical protein HOQ29_16170 [Acidobacteria bacterium]|nr:hypothetical protein [Acidobacteriota bacterium]